MGRKYEVLSCSEGWGAPESERERAGGVCVTVVRGTEVGSISRPFRRRTSVRQKVFLGQESPGELLKARCGFPIPTFARSLNS